VKLIDNYVDICAYLQLISTSKLVEFSRLDCAGIIFLITVGIVLLFFLFHFEFKKFDFFYFLYRLKLWPNFFYLYFSFGYFILSLSTNLFFRSPEDIKLLMECLNNLPLYFDCFLYGIFSPRNLVCNANTLKAEKFSFIFAFDHFLMAAGSGYDYEYYGYRLTVTGGIFYNPSEGEETIPSKETEGPKELSLEETIPSKETEGPKELSLEETEIETLLPRFPRFFPLYGERQPSKNFYRGRVFIKTLEDARTRYGERDFALSFLFYRSSRGAHLVALDYENSTGYPIRRYLPKKFPLSRVFVKRIQKELAFELTRKKIFKERLELLQKSPDVIWPQWFLRTRIGHYIALSTRRFFMPLRDFYDTIFLNFRTYRSSALVKALWWRRRTLKVRMPLEIWEQNLLAMAALPRREPQRNFELEGGTIRATLSSSLAISTTALPSHYRSHTAASYSIFHTKTLRGFLERKVPYSRPALFQKPITRDTLDPRLHPYLKLIQRIWKLIFIIFVFPIYVHGLVFNNELWNVLLWYERQRLHLYGREKVGITLYGIPRKPLRSRFRQLLLTKAALGSSRWKVGIRSLDFFFWVRKRNLVTSSFSRVGGRDLFLFFYDSLGFWRTNHRNMYWYYMGRTDAQGKVYAKKVYYAWDITRVRQLERKRKFTDISRPVAYMTIPTVFKEANRRGSWQALVLEIARERDEQLTEWMLVDPTEGTSGNFIPDRFAATKKIKTIGDALNIFHAANPQQIPGLFYRNAIEGTFNDIVHEGDLGEAELYVSTKPGAYLKKPLKGIHSTYSYAIEAKKIRKKKELLRKLLQSEVIHHISPHRPHYRKILVKLQSLGPKKPKIKPDWSKRKLITRRDL
jgi:hypothetical protein